MIGRLLRLGWDRWDDRHWSGDDDDRPLEPRARDVDQSGEAEIGAQNGTQRLPGPSQPGGGCRDCVWTWDIRQGGRWVRQCDECGKGNG